MTFDTRLVIVALSVFAIANGIVSFAVWRLWPTRAREAAPMDRAAALLQLRLAPAILAVSSTLFALFAFVEYEPRDNGERMGVVLIGFSSAAALMIAVSAIRGLIGVLRTASLVRSWTSSAESISLPEMSVPCFAIDEAFPVVAIVGLLQPRLFIARSVLSTCPPDELHAILRHEEGHVRRRDNIRSLLFLAAPDCLAWTPIGRRVQQLWHDASEEVADDAAAPDKATRLHLAAALVRVAKLVPVGHRPTALPISALYRGEPLETRVRRLIDGPAAGATSIWRAWHIVAILAFVAIGIASAGLIQDIVEAAVKFLP